MNYRAGSQSFFGQTQIYLCGNSLDETSFNINFSMHSQLGVILNCKSGLVPHFSKKSFLCLFWEQFWESYRFFSKWLDLQPVGLVTPHHLVNHCRLPLVVWFQTQPTCSWKWLSNLDSRFIWEPDFPCVTYWLNCCCARKKLKHARQFLKVQTLNSLIHSWTSLM